MNDFLMAVTLQNVKNAFEEITDTFQNSVDFEPFCCELADQIYLASIQ